MLERRSDVTHPDPRPPLRLSGADWFIYAIVVACLIGAWAYSCSRGAGVQQCMRDGSASFFGVVLQGAIIGGAIWSGVAVARRAHSGFVGWVAGIALVLVFSGVLTAVGLTAGH